MKLVGSVDSVAPEATAVMASVLGVAVANRAPVPAPAINLVEDNGGEEAPGADHQDGDQEAVGAGAAAPAPLEHPQPKQLNVKQFLCGYDGCVNQRGQPYGLYAGRQQVKEHYGRIHGNGGNGN